MAWENMTDIFTPEGMEKVKVGQLLMFDFEGSRNDYKIMRKSHGKVWGKRVETVDPSQVLVTDKEGVTRHMEDMYEI